MSTTPKVGGDASAVSTLRPRPECMSEFLPLWNKRIAHITAADAARTRAEALRPEADAVSAAALRGEVPLHVATQMVAKLQEEIDAAALHDAEAVACGEAMRALQYEPTTTA